MNNQIKGWIFFLITIFFFSTVEVVTKPVSGQINPYQMTFLRFFIGGIILLFYMLIKKEYRKTKITFKDIVVISAIGSLNSVISMSLLQVAVSLTSASTAAILISSNPVFVIFAAAVFLNEKLTLKKIFSAVVGVLGLSAIIISKSSGDSLKGILIGILASVIFSFYTVFVKKYTKNIPGSVFAPISFIFPSVIFYFILMMRGINPFAVNYSFNLLCVILYTGIFVTGIAYITFFEGIKRLDASVGSFSYLLKPLISTILSVIFLGEIPGLMKIFGLCLIIISILLVATKKY